MKTGTKFKFDRIPYSSLKGRQKENYNFQKVSGALADFGFSTVRLTDDWEGADFVAQHADGKTMLRVQLKPRLYFSKKYMGKDLWMCFRQGDDIYLFPHDKVLELMLASDRIIKGTTSWEVSGAYSFTTISKWIKPMLEEHKIPSIKAKETQDV